MATATLQISSIQPVLTVNDLKASIRFYGEGLGFNVREEMGEQGEVQGVMLEAGEAKLGLSQDDFAKGRDRVKGVGMRLYLETSQDIQELAQRAKAAGITLENGPAPQAWGPMGLTVKDPDGFRITISNPQ